MAVTPQQVRDELQELARAVELLAKAVQALAGGQSGMAVAGPAKEAEQIAYGLQ